MQPLQHVNNDATTGRSRDAGLDGAAKPSMPQSAIAREFNHFVEDIEELLQASTLMSGDDLARAKEKISQRIAAARKSAEATGGAIVDQARKSVADTDTYVHQQPWQAIGVGAGVGLVVGFLLARRLQA
jgi:ElaB/YqjD/DUF883 family membrane-anchored ribosome-binding protein